MLSSNGQPIVYIIRAFACSGIGQSVSVEVSLGNESIKPMNSQSANEMDIDVSDAVAEEIVLESTADALKDHRREQQQVGTEKLNII